MDTTISHAPQEADLTEIFIKLKDQYRNVFIHQFGQYVFFYRALGRKEYKTIIDDKVMNDFQKENVICEVCTLYPEGINFNELEAGIPSKLTELIIKNSFLDSIEARQNLLGYYRAQMYDLDNQISCLINEAFPQFDLEDIEEWDVDKTTKYLSRAEWKLHNLRGLQFVEPEGTFNGQSATKAQTQSNQERRETTNAATDPSKTIRGKDKGKTKITPDKIREMEEFAKKFPNFGSEWGEQYGVDVSKDDSVFKEGIKGLRGEGTLPPALKTPNMY